MVSPQGASGSYLSRGSGFCELPYRRETLDLWLTAGEEERQATWAGERQRETSLLEAAEAFSVSSGKLCAKHVVF
jgi:hypothetical protein